MGKSLLNKLGKGAKRIGRGIRNGVLVATAVASLGFAGCNLCGPNPEPNHPPVVQTIPNQSINEGEGYQYQVIATDSDGDNLTYSLTQIPQTPPWLSINPSTGVIFGVAPSINDTIDYNISVKVSDGQDSDIQNYPLTVKNIPEIFDYLDIEGYLQDNESDTGKPGIVKIYNPLDLTIPLAQVEANESGYFGFHSIDRLVSEFPTGVIIKAISTNPSGNQNSYVRKINANIDPTPGIEPDVTVNPIRVVPYPDSSKNENFTASEFKDFMADINRSSGISKFDLSKLQRIRIFKYNRGGSPAGSFSNPGNVKNSIVNNHLSGWFERESVPIDVVEGNAPDEMPPSGWIFIEPYNTFSNPDELGNTTNYPDYTFSNSALIKLKSTTINPVDYTIAHEFGHASGVAIFEADGYPTPNVSPHLTYYPNHLTVMEYPSDTPEGTVTPGFADLKAAKIIQENTYGLEENLNNILGTSF